MKIQIFAQNWDLLKIKTTKLLLFVALGSKANSGGLSTTIGSCVISFIGSVGGDWRFDFAHITKKIKYRIKIKLV